MSRIFVLAGPAISLKRPLQAFALFVCVGAAQAQQSPADPTMPAGPVYAFTTTADQEIDNDRLTVVLVAQETGDDPATLADRINRLMGDALSQLAGLDGFDAIEARTLGYRITPDYRRDSLKGGVQRWTASQSLQLRTGDFAAGTEAIAAVQDILQVQQMTFDVLPATRREAIDALITVALERFEARAQLIARTMGTGVHRVLDADVRTDEAMGPPGQPMMMARAADASGSAAPVTVAGSSTVSVSVSGRVELSEL